MVVFCTIKQYIIHKLFLQGVGIKINKYTGEVKLKGPNHWEWFKENIDAFFDCAPDMAATKDIVSEMIERALGLQGIAVSIQDYTYF